MALIVAVTASVALTLPVIATVTDNETASLTLTEAVTCIWS